MKERGRIFSSEMVKAILDGRKTQTRRPMKPQPEWRSEAWYWYSKAYDNGDGVHYFHTKGLDGIMDEWIRACPHGQPGDTIWVRETFARWPLTNQIPDQILFKADYSKPEIVKWTSPRFMPKWASRITLEVVDVRVERLQEITEKEALFEGTPLANDKPFTHMPSAVLGFQYYWDSLYTKKPEYQWEKNIWVWVIGFRNKEIKPNVKS